MNANVVKSDVKDNMILKLVVQHEDFVKSASVKGETDLNASLDLNINVIRKSSSDSQSNFIKDAFESVLENNDCDRPEESLDNMQDNVLANETLTNPDTKAKYNNRFDIIKSWCHKGWRKILSKSKLYLWPEAETNMNVLRLMQIPFLLLISALGVCFCAGKFGARLKNDVIGFALIWAGSNSFFTRLKKNSNRKDWFLSFVINGIFGALNGGVMTWIEANFKVAIPTMTPKHTVQMGVIAGSIGGFLQSIGSDFERFLLFNKIKKAWIIPNFMISVLIGSVIGFVGGVISGYFGGFISESNVDEVAEVGIVRKNAIHFLKWLVMKSCNTSLNLTKDCCKERLKTSADKSEKLPSNQSATYKRL